jgi:FkbM family methyltransferase
MANATGRVAPTQTLAFLWRIWRQYGLAECLTAVRRKMRFRRLNLGQPPGELVLRDKVRFRVVPEVVSAFRYFTDIDPDMCQEMDAFLTLSRGSKRLLDVGAHYGTFSLAFTANGGEAALAIEPSPKAYGLLTRHIALNPNSMIQAEQIALGNHSGKLMMRYDDMHLVVTPTPGDQEQQVEASATTVDALIRDRSFQPDTLKIDVEGYELCVLEGARDLLWGAGPLVFLEVHPHLLRGLGRSVEELVLLMEGSGYGFADTHGAPIPDPRTFLSGGIRRVVCRKLVAA